MNEVVLTGFQKVGFWFLKHFSKKLLLKHFPLLEYHFDISVSSSRIFISESSNYCNLHFTIQFKNFTNYDLLLKFVKISMYLNNRTFMDLENIILKQLKFRSMHSVSLNIPLTYYQVQLIKSMLTNSNSILNLDFHLNIFTTNIFGEKIFSKQLNERIEINLGQ